MAACSGESRRDQNSDSDASPRAYRIASAEPEHLNESAERSSPAPVNQTGDTARSPEPRPPGNKIANDCLAFLRATKVVPAQTKSDDCPECPTGSTEVLKFQGMNTDRVFCSTIMCHVEVTIRAFFNPGSGEMTGGLTGWIPPEQRTEYLAGNTPPGEQVYRVKIIYKRVGDGWRAVEFDRAEPR